MSRRLFGTDGIRGMVVAAQQDEQLAVKNLHEQRIICTTLLRLVGESLGRTIDQLPGTGNHVVIGWDDRPNNTELVAALTLGLRLTGCAVVHVGMCATPALHRATLVSKARIGCMITASHNPVSDSGLKIFDADGYKTKPEYEDLVSSVAEGLAAEEREIDAIDVAELSQPNQMSEAALDAAQHHPKWLDERYMHFQHLIGSNGIRLANVAKPFLIDASRGAAYTWLAQWLTERGVDSIEVSHEATALNLNCGAGDFSPTQKWTFEEAKTSPHLLLQNLSPSPPGTMVGAALDGDGDRCLVIEATTEGFMVVDGDSIGDAILCSSTQQDSRPWHLAASIESDLSLLATANRLPAAVQTSETAVGDRWLSKVLGEALTNSVSPPRSLGVEDSGHIVMPTPHPHKGGEWALVGDGAATLVAYLLARSNDGDSNQMVRGWKKRRSVNGVDRSLWNGTNMLADEVEAMARSFFEQQGNLQHWDRHGLEGEPNLMLVSFELNGHPGSLGVRNSGTQAKISVSLRLSPNIEAGDAPHLIEAITHHLDAKMKA
jgi:phosphoglucosamine mutase